MGIATGDGGKVAGDFAFCCCHCENLLFCCGCCVLAAGRCAAGPAGRCCCWGLPCGLMPGGAVRGLALSRGAGGFHFLRPGRGIRTRRTWPERPAAGAICFVGRCTGSRWAYAVPRRGGCHCVAMGARRCDRCRGRVMLLPMSARRCCGGGWDCTSGGGCRRPCGSLWIMPGPGRPDWRNRAAPGPSWGRRRAGCDARRRRRACWASLR